MLGRQTTTDRGGYAHAPVVMIRNRRNRRYGLDHQGLEGSRGAAVVVFATLASDPLAWVCHLEVGLWALRRGLLVHNHLCRETHLGGDSHL